jgi:hypothetical protein
VSAYSFPPGLKVRFPKNEWATCGPIREGGTIDQVVRSSLVFSRPSLVFSPLVVKPFLRCRPFRIPDRIKTRLRFLIDRGIF